MATLTRAMSPHAFHRQKLQVTKLGSELGTPGSNACAALSGPACWHRRKVTVRFQGTSRGPRLTNTRKGRAI